MNETNSGATVSEAVGSDAAGNGAAEGAAGVVQQAQQRVGEVVGEVVAPAVSQAVGQVQQKTGEVVSQAQQRTGEVVSQAQQQVAEKAASRLSQQKEHAVGGLGAVAEALRQTGQQLREQDQGAITQYAAQYGDAAAGQVERLGSYLGERDVNQLVHEVEDFARREPALFIGGAFLLGMLGARFLKTSSRPPALPAPGSMSGIGSGAASGNTSYSHLVDQPGMHRASGSNGSAGASDAVSMPLSTFQGANLNAALDAGGMGSSSGASSAAGVVSAGGGASSDAGSS